MHAFSVYHLAPSLLQPAMSELQFTNDVEEFQSFCESFRHFFGLLSTNLLPAKFMHYNNIQNVVNFVENAYQTNFFFNSRGMPINKYIVDAKFLEHKELINSFAAAAFLNAVYYAEPFLSIYLILIFILVNLCFKLTASPFHF
jgi:hypothetical protein